LIWVNGFPSFPSTYLLLTVESPLIDHMLYSGAEIIAILARFFNNAKVRIHSRTPVLLFTLNIKPFQSRLVDSLMYWNTFTFRIIRLLFYRGHNRKKFQNIVVIFVFASWSFRHCYSSNWGLSKAVAMLPWPYCWPKRL
jgi:hypothetical protein